MIRQSLVVLGALAGAALGVAGWLQPAAATPAVPARTYVTLAPACSISDKRVDSISGMSVRTDGTWVVNDRGAVLYRLASDCSVAQRVDLGPELDKLGLSLFDVEDLALGPDGVLWLADSGGNRRSRTSITLVGWKDSTTPVKVVTLRYASGTHDVEAVMLDMTGRAVVVTKESGPAQVFASRLPVGAGAQNLHLMGTRTIPRASGAAPGARLVTAGDVDRTGTFVTLRTYTDGWEFDAPDGDLAKAILTATPRRVLLPKTAQGEAIAYQLDGSGLLTTGEGSPVNLDRVQIVRAGR